MVWWLTSSTRTRRIRGGKKERAFCPDCDETTTFVEVELQDSVQLMSLIDVDGDKQRAFRCSECDAVGQLVDTDALGPEDLTDLPPAAAERLRRTRAAERRARAEAERRRLEAERADREARADDELLALKARMGLLPAPADDDDSDNATSKRPWWKRWRS